MFWLRLLGAAILAGTAAIATVMGTDYVGRYTGAVASDDHFALLHEEAGVSIYEGTAPSWTDRLIPPNPETATAQRVQGARMLLWDIQADLAGRKPSIYYDAVVDPLTQLGVQTASLFTIGFRPDIQQLIVHDVSVFRDGSWESRMDMLSINISRPSSPSASLVFTGEVEVLLRIANVRPDDLVRYAYSITGQADVVDHGNSQFVSPPVFPAERVRASLRLPEEEGSFAAFGDFQGAEVSQNGRYRDVVFFDGPHASPMVDPLVPIWHFQSSFAMGTTTPDWETISDWTAELFQPARSDAIDEIADEIRRQHSDREGQIMAALRYVQREIRYFAVVLGDAGYMPADPDETLTRSEGECKAKTKLLISILDALGIDAQAALVNSMFGPGIDQLPPSVMAFNHVITTLEHDGERFWLDPTASEQGGTLDSVYQHEYGWALIGGGSGDLVWMDSPIDEPMVTINERYVMSGDSAGDPAKVTIEWTYYGPWADAVRSTRDSIGDEQMAQGFMRFYSQRYANYGERAPMQIRDESEANRITIALNWDIIPRAFNVNPNDPSVIVFAAHAAYPLVVPLERAREEAVVLNYPYHVVHRVDVEFPSTGTRWPVNEAVSASRENEAFSHSYEVIPRDNGVQLVAELQIQDRELFGAEQAEALRHAREVNEGVVLLIGPENVLVDTRLLPTVMEPSLIAYPMVVQQQGS